MGSAREFSPKSFSGRLEDVKNTYGVTWRGLSRMCSFESETHAKNIADAGACTMAQLIKIRIGTRVNLNWLLTGEETMGLVVTEAANVSKEIAARTRGKRGKKARTAKLLRDDTPDRSSGTHSVGQKKT